MAEKKKIQAGALWVKNKERGDGTKYRVLSILLDLPVDTFKEMSEVYTSDYDEAKHVKLNISAFKNQYKDNDKHPDYKLFVYPKKED